MLIFFMMMFLSDFRVVVVGDRQEASICRWILAHVFTVTA